MKKTILIILSIIIMFSNDIRSFASEDYITQWENRKKLPIESNSFEGWPEGPAIGASAAILIEAGTGTILYAKNMHEKHYPASTTKILSTLIGIENANLEDDVHISREAVFSIEPGSSNVGLDPGEVITVEQCLYAILVGSANEATNALAEHVSGSIKDFVELMNKRSKELGCLNSHFITTNGLHDPEHYTTPYDLAQIARTFFSNEMLCKISSTARYYIPKSPTQPDEDLYINTHNQLLMSSGKYSYEYIVGSKTGYTSNSRQTLVSCAEKDGMKLICVVMKEESPHQFEETIKLFDWGFEKFKKINISENEKSYSIEEARANNYQNDIFDGSSSPIDIDKDDYVIVPYTAAFKYLDSEIEYVDEKRVIARINYMYHNRPVGKARVRVSERKKTDVFDFEKGPVWKNDTLNGDEDNGKEQLRANVVYVNIKTVIIRILICYIALMILFSVFSVFGDYNFAGGRSKSGGRGFRRLRIKRVRRKSPFDDYDL